MHSIRDRHLSARRLGAHATYLLRALLRALQFATVSVANFPRTSPRAYADFPAWDLLKAHAIAQRLHDGDSLLDVGCGSGHFLRELGLFRSLSSAGIDLAVPAQPSGLDLRTYDGQTLPFQDKSFDVVFFGYVLHHLTSEHAARLISEATRVARRSVIMLEDSLPSFDLWYRTRNWAHRLEAELSYAEQSSHYRPGDGERMFLTHEEWRRFLAKNPAIAEVELRSLSAISRYAHHTLIEASLAPQAREIKRDEGDSDDVTLCPDQGADNVKSHVSSTQPPRRGVAQVETLDAELSSQKKITPKWAGQSDTTWIG